MTVDYNNYAKTFSQSRKNMKWEEIDYFLEYLQNISKINSPISNLSILDVGCGNGRLLESLKNSNLEIINYLGIDLSGELLKEAKEIHPNFDFLELDMSNLDKLDRKFNIIFFIASFHHLETIEERLDVIKKAYSLLEKDGIIFMTNWMLNIGKNKEKYKNSSIENSENEFGSKDFDIKIGEYTRYYHSFSLLELEFLFKSAGFEIIENRIFDTEKNFISILKK